MESQKKAFMVVAVIAIICSLMSTQYVVSRTNMLITIDAKGAYIVLGGVDRVVEGGGTTSYVLQNNTGNYTLNFGSWLHNTTKIYTAAIVVVNREPYPIYLYKADISTLSGVKIYIWAHPNATKLPEAFRDHSAEDTGRWVYNLTDPSEHYAWKIGASPTAYDKNTVVVRLYNLSGTGAYRDTSLSWVKSGTGYIWALPQFDIASDGTIFEGAIPGCSNCVFIYVKIMITNNTQVNNIYASLKLYFSSCVPPGYTEISSSWWNTDWKCRRPITIQENSGNNLIDYQVAINITYDSDMKTDFSDLRFTWKPRTWWNTSWQFRKPIIIYEQSGNSLIDYQVAINITYNSHMQPDFDDLRFTWFNETSNEEQKIPYWIESKSDGNWAYVWIKIPEIPANGQAMVYVYYGNTTAVTSESDGDAVFEFFDDFEGTSLNTSKWVAYADDYAVSNSILRINKGGIELTSALPFNIQDGYIVETKIKHEVSATNYGGVLPEVASSSYTASGNANADATILYMRGYSDDTVEYWIGDGSTNSYNVAEAINSGWTPENGVWYITGISVEGGTVKLWRDGVAGNTTTGINWAKNLRYIKLGSYDRNDSRDIQDTSYDWIRIRKYTDPEPYVLIGNEQIHGEQKLPYWIESKSDGNWAYIWVKVPEIPANEQTTVYMYYGNSQASSESNVTNTFIRVIDGVVGAWHFDESSETTEYDASGYGNDGTYYGEVFNDGVVNGSSWVYGKHGKALSFDGVDDYVELPLIDDVRNDKNWTVAMWIKPESLDGALIGFIDGYETETHNGWWIELVNGDIKYVYEYGSGNNQEFVWDVNLEVGEWYHIVLRRVQSAARLFINGIDKGRMEGNTATGGNETSIFRIGIRSYGTFFNGTIDEVRIYNKTLSDADIKTIYENNTFIRDYLVAYWRFDDGSGTTAHDTHHIVYETNKDGTKFINALSFDGENDYVEVPDSNSLDAQDYLTIVAWVYPRGVPTGASGDDRWIIVEKLGAYYMTYDYNQKLAVYWYDTSSEGYHVSNATIPTNTWTFVASVWDGSYVHLYINGELDRSVATSTPGRVNNNPLHIGYESSSLPRSFNGIMDEIYIFNKSLTQEEIWDLYNNYGYTTTNYLGKVLVRKYTSPETTYLTGEEQVLLQG